MTTRQLVSKLIEAADIENKEQLISAIGKIPESEIGDEFKPLEEAMGRIIDERVAHMKPEVAEKIRSGVYRELTTAQIEQFRKAGLAEEELKELEAMQVYDRTQRSIEFVDRALQKKYSVSQSHREIELEAKSKILEEKIKAEEARHAAEKSEFLRQFEETQKRNALHGFVKSLPLNNEVLNEGTRVIVATDMIENYIESIGGQIVFNNGQLHVRKKGSSDVLFENNSVVDLTKAAKKALEAQNLLKKEEKMLPPIPGGGIPNRVIKINNVNRAQAAFASKYNK
jgi:hypothetical protein